MKNWEQNVRRDGLRMFALHNRRIRQPEIMVPEKESYEKE